MGLFSAGIDAAEAVELMEAARTGGHGGVVGYRRHRGPFRIVFGMVLGAAVFGTSIGLLLYGILGLVGRSHDVDAKAVGTGIVSGEPQAVQFEVPPGGDRTYTVYAHVDSGGSEDDDPGQAEAASIDCIVAPRVGSAIGLSGAHGASVSVGSLHVIGTFSVPPGHVRVACTSNGSGAGRKFVVSPGKASSIVIMIGAIIVGAFGLFIGGGMFIWGAVGRRVTLYG